MLFRKVFRKPNKEAEEKLRRDIEEHGVEKKDIGAMIFSAYLVFIPVILLLLGIFCLVAYLFVR